MTDEAAFGLILNGAYLDFCLDPHNEERFVNLLKGYFVAPFFSFLILDAGVFFVVVLLPFKRPV